MAEQFGINWWGKRWLQALAQIDYSNRIPRGLRYARNGSVLNITIKDDTVKAKVQGTRKYTVTLSVPQFSSDQVAKFIDKLLKSPAIIANLLNHHLDTEVLGIAQQLKMNIFPQSWRDIKMHCTCPDSAVPCKHIAAVIYLISKEIDNDPFVVFKLHGVDILQELEQRQIRIENSNDEIPTLASLLKPTSDKDMNFNVENAYKPVSYTGLRDLTEILPRLLSDKPSFDSKYNFLDYYKRQMAYAVKNVGKSLISPYYFFRQDHDSEPLPIKSHTQFKYILLEDGEFQSFCDSRLIDEYILMRTLLSLNVEDVNSYSPSVAASYRLLLTAITLVQHGAVIPQIYHSGKNEIRIRWIPALLDKAVTAIVEHCKSILPPQTVIFSFKKGKKNLKQYVENPAFEILSQFISLLISSFNTFAVSEDVHCMMWYRQVIDLSMPGKSTIGSNVASWLSRLYVNAADFRPVVIVQESENDTFAVSFGVEDKRKDEAYIELGKFFTQKQYADEKFKVMQMFSSLGDFIKGMSAHLNNNAKKPITYGMEQMGDFLFNLLPVIQMMDVKVLLPKTLDKILRPKATLKLKSGGGTQNKSFVAMSELLDFDWQIALGDERLTPDEFMKLFKKYGKLMKIKNQYVTLDEEDFNDIMRKLQQKEMSSMQLLQTALAQEYDGVTVTLDENLKECIEAVNRIESVELPTNLQATLRPYQECGYWWMYRNTRLGIGSIIADDMGLGKTLQVIALLLKLKQEDELSSKTPAVVIVPTALLFNWEKEIDRFAPELSHAIYHGAGRDIKQVSADIILTTYGTLRSDAPVLKKKKPSVLVIDEAQNIKNADTAQTKAVKTINAPIRIAMSGTPVENRLSEFWSIMDFTNKGLLGTAKAFDNDFGKPIQLDNDELVAARFRKITAPFMLRRLKTDKSIINDLPDKIEQNEYASLTAEQAALYEKVIDMSMNDIENVDDADSKAQFKRSGLILQMLLQLKQICNHPTQYLKDDKVDAMLSGKSQMLLQLLETIVNMNEKVLIFTQFYEMGELLQKFIALHFGEEPLFYHGGCSVKERSELVRRFQEERSDRIFILTIKSAGVGLNLTAASHVIHYDLWWNPAVETQATDRAYRIGQDKTVQVHRFITRNTFEEKIDAMIQSKKQLADLTVATGENWIGKLSNEELKEIFERKK